MCVDCLLLVVVWCLLTVVCCFVIGRWPCVGGCVLCVVFVV